MNWLNKIKRWPITKKRVLAISLATFITILIIVFNSAISILWKDNTPVKSNKNTTYSSVKDTFLDIFNQVKPILNQASDSSSTIMNAPVSQNIQSTSSLSTTSNVVE